MAAQQQKNPKGNLPINDVSILQTDGLEVDYSKIYSNIYRRQKWGHEGHQHGFGENLLCNPQNQGVCVTAYR